MPDRFVIRSLVIALAALVLTGMCPAAYAQTHPPRSVLALYFSSEDYPANPIHDDGIRDGLRSRPDWPIDYHTEYLESDRFPNEQATLALRDYLREKYQGRKIDAVVAVTETSLRFMLRFRADLFPDAPIVYFGNVPVDEKVRTDGAGITGVIVGNGFVEGLRLALRLHPATEQLFVVAQTPNLAFHDSIREAFKQTAGHARLTFINRESVPAMLEDVRAVPPNSLIFYVRQSQEDPGRVLFAADVARLVADASPVPVYGVTDSYMGTGVVGGAMYLTRAIGVRLGEQVIRIFDGTAAQAIPIEHFPTRPIFDARQLRRWGISESRLPPGSTLLYRQVGVWDQYRPQIIAALMLVTLQAALIAALLVQRVRRRRVETALIESQQRYSLASAAGAVGVWDWNIETNELFVDERLKWILGFADSEISRRPDDWGSRVHPDDLQESTAKLQECLDGRSDIYETEHRMLHKDGTVKWMLSRGSAIRGADGRVRRLVGTKVDITQLKSAQDAMRESQAVLRASHDQIQDLAGRLIESQEVERARIARDLHDDLSQQIAGLSIALSEFRRRIAAVPQPRDLSGEVSALQDRTLALAENIRSLSHDLHPSVLQHAGLVAALSGYCADTQQQHREVTISFVTGSDITADKAAALCLYRVAQEALRNVVTHSRASHAEVRLLRVGDQLELIVSDNGAGFDIRRAGRRHPGLGLVSIDERVRLAGGTATITTELGKGTRVRVQVPAWQDLHGGASIAALAAHADATD
jgi:PAS domain S-box-containing protein